MECRCTGRILRDVSVLYILPHVWKVFYRIGGRKSEIDVLPIEIKLTESNFDEHMRVYFRIHVNKV